MKKPKLKWKNMIIYLIFLFSFILLIKSSIEIIIWSYDSIKTNKELQETQEETKIVEVKDNDKTEVIEQNQEIEKTNPYWDYIKMNLIDVDFNELKKKNNDTKGWIKVNGTNINYPFVQTNNNDYYLNHSFNRKYNQAGWVYLDYRNNISNLDKNNILYAHARIDNTMFGTLKNILSNGWLEDKNNYVIKVSTESHNTLWQVFSIYHIKETNDYLKVNFENENEFLKFKDLLINRSIYNFQADLSSNDKILTLSTCYNEDERMVLHAKLIKIENK